MSKTKFVSGFRDGIPIALGYLAVSFGLGISCRAASLTPFQGFLLSLLNNASAGEYGGITIMAADEGFLVMAAMMLVINARYLLMSCALSQHLSPNTPLGFRLLIGFDMTDELFGIAIAQPGYLNVWYFIGAMCAAIPGWSFGTLRQPHAPVGSQRLFRDAVRNVPGHHHSGRPKKSGGPGLYRGQLPAVLCGRQAPPGMSAV